MSIITKTILIKKSEITGNFLSRGGIYFAARRFSNAVGTFYTGNPPVCKVVGGNYKSIGAICNAAVTIYNVAGGFHNIVGGFYKGAGGFYNAVGGKFQVVGFVYLSVAVKEFTARLKRTACETFRFLIFG